MQSRAGGIILSSVTPIANIRRPLNNDEILSVALRIFMLQSLGFEALQNWTQTFGESSFSEEDLFARLLAAMDVVVLLRLENGAYKIIGRMPTWYEVLIPTGKRKDGIVYPEEEFPYLGDFLMDSDALWGESDASPLRSGIWSEADSEGKRYHLEAMAVRIGPQDILLIELKHTLLEVAGRSLQKSREIILLYRQALRELQRTEVRLKQAFVTE